LLAPTTAMVLYFLKTSWGLMVVLGVMVTDISG